MQRAEAHPTDFALARLGNRFTTWVLGTGLLAFHAGLFAVAMVGMLLWNIYDAPRDLWVDGVFRRWGALLAFHAIAVAAGWTAWRLMRAEQRAIDTATVRPRAAAQPPVYLLDERTATAWNVPPASPVVVVPARPSYWQRYVQLVHRAERASRPVVVAAVVWSGSVGRRAVALVTRRAAPAPVAAPAPMAVVEAPPPDPSGWPTPPRETGDTDAFIARFGAAEPAATDVDVVLGVSPADLPAPAPIVKDANATWVETATSSWLPKADGQNGHHDHREEPAAPADAAPPTA